jgi:hypothetical protein
MEIDMTEDQIKHMVDRFLMWKLPADFSPDNGISFDAVASYFGSPEKRQVRQPVGTNLLTATQATAMVRHMLDGLPPE